MNTIKVNNPRWFALYMTPHIERYSKKVNIPGITYESLVTHFAQVIQYGGDLSEVWVAFNDNEEPIGFAMWSVMPIPYIGTVILQHIHSWDKGKFGITNELVKQFGEFARKHKCTFFKADAINDSALRLFKSIAKKNGTEIDILQTIPFTGRVV